MSDKNPEKQSSELSFSFHEKFTFSSRLDPLKVQEKQVPQTKASPFLICEESNSFSFCRV